MGTELVVDRVSDVSGGEGGLGFVVEVGRDAMGMTTTSWAGRSWQRVARTIGKGSGKNEGRPHGDGRSLPGNVRRCDAHHVEGLVFESAGYFLYHAGRDRDNCRQGRTADPNSEIQIAKQTTTARRL